MESKEYRLTRTYPGQPYLSHVRWHVHVTHGLLDVEYIGSANTQPEARALAKAHAARSNVKPLILT